MHRMNLKKIAYYRHLISLAIIIAMSIVPISLHGQQSNTTIDSTLRESNFSEISYQYQDEAGILNSQAVEPIDLSDAVLQSKSMPTVGDTPAMNDTMPCEHFSFKQLIAPGVLLGLGLLGTINEKNGVNKAVKDCMDDWRGTHSCKIDNYLRFLPSAAYLGLGFIPGVKAKHNTRERLLVAATSHASMLALGYGFKLVFKERRPDMSDRKSFPSGHVSLAFTGAELMRIEYGNGYGLGGYAAATAVAFLRLYNNKHWLHDVVMGAGIGILSARIGYWLLPFERKLLKINNKKASATVAAMPSYNPEYKSVGVSFVAQF